MREAITVFVDFLKKLTEINSRTLILSVGVRRLCVKALSLLYCYNK